MCCGSEEMRDRGRFVSVASDDSSEDRSKETGIERDAPGMARTKPWHRTAAEQDAAMASVARLHADVEAQRARRENVPEG